MFTLNLGLPPIDAANLAYSDTGLRLPKADCGRLAIVCELKEKSNIQLQNQIKKPWKRLFYLP